jgi:hypothetical protein
MKKYDIGTKEGHIDKYRRAIPGSGLGHVVNTEAWGTATAYSRYGVPQTPNTRPPDQSGPQRLGDPNNLQGPKYHSDTPNDWRRGAGESAEGKPNFIPGHRGKR